MHIYEKKIGGEEAPTCLEDPPLVQCDCIFVNSIFLVQVISTHNEKY